jgi:hypothetical protein
MKMIVIWDVELYSLVDVDRRFREVYCLHHEGDECMVLMKAAVSSSETSVNIYQTSLPSIPEDIVCFV